MPPFPGRWRNAIRPSAEKRAFNKMRTMGLRGLPGPWVIGHFWGIGYLDFLVIPEPAMPGRTTGDFRPQVQSRTPAAR